MKKGDYVLATKYSDGDPQDHWVVGFFDSMMDCQVGKRFHIVDGEGKPFRGNGFRRARVIKPDVGQFFVANMKDIEQSGRSIWSHLYWYERGRIEE